MTSNEADPHTNADPARHHLLVAGSDPELGSRLSDELDVYNFARLRRHGPA
ncbi:MAG TPA: hypothetical protein VGD51_18445 [Nocardioidaceae bacterium]